MCKKLKPTFTVLYILVHFKMHKIGLYIGISLFYCVLFRRLWFDRMQLRETILCMCYTTREKTAYEYNFFAMHNSFCFSVLFSSNVHCINLYLPEIKHSIKLQPCKMLYLWFHKKMYLNKNKKSKQCNLLSLSFIMMTEIVAVSQMVTWWQLH